MNLRRDNSNIAKASITAIADLLSCFDSSDDYAVWEKQMKLKTTYRLSDEYVKILISIQIGVWGRF